MKIRAAVVTFAVLLLVGIGAARAERGSGRTSVLSARGDSSPAGAQAPDGTPDAILSIEMGGRQSWDTWDSPNNELFAEILGAGAVVTGVGWRDLAIATVPDTGSWLWDAVTSLYSSHPDAFFVDISPGSGDGPGSAVYSSGGILDLGDYGIDNLPIGDDGLMYVQLWEDPDDVEDVADADYLGGAYDIAYIAGTPVPTASTAALVILGLLLLASGSWLIARKLAYQP